MSPRPTVNRRCPCPARQSCRILSSTRTTPSCRFASRVREPVPEGARCIQSTGDRHAHAALHPRLSLVAVASGAAVAAVTAVATAVATTVAAAAIAAAIAAVAAVCTWGASGGSRCVYAAGCAECHIERRRVATCRRHVHGQRHRSA
eukprot:874591-Prymnesium_polylepis.4